MNRYITKGKRWEKDGKRKRGRDDDYWLEYYEIKNYSEANLTKAASLSKPEKDA